MIRKYLNDRSLIYLYLIFLQWIMKNVKSDSFSFTTRDDLKEFCESEKFIANCASPDEVIYVIEAYSGLLKQGRCHGNTYAQIGCYENVTDYMNYKCAGQRNCSLKLSDDDYLEKEFARCPKEFKRALFIKYDCIKVDRAACATCSQYRTARLSNKSGYLSSIIAEESRNGNQCGSYKCPWSIVVSPGQRINVSVFDYSGRVSQKHAVNKYKDRDDCLKLMTIKEKSNPKDGEVCGGGGVSAGHRQVYLSTSNSVEMYVNVDIFSRSHQFIIHYEATGCPDIVPTPNMWMNRKVDKLEVGCLPSETFTWEMMCVNNEWKGIMGSCDGGDPSVGSVFSRIGTSMSSFFSSLPFGILLAGVLAIIIILSVCILTVGYVCYKRSHHQLNYKRRPQSISGDQYIDLNDPNNLLVQKVIVGKTLSNKTGKSYNYANTTVAGGPNENKYTGRAMMMANQMIQSGGGVRPLPSIPDLRGTGANTNHRTGGGGGVQPPRMMIRSYGDGGGMGVRPTGGYPMQGGRPTYPGDQQQQHEYYVIEDRNRMNNNNNMMINNNTGSSGGSDSFPPPPDLLFPADSTQGSLMRPQQQQQLPPFSQQQQFNNNQLQQQQQQQMNVVPTYRPPMTLSSALKQQSNNTYENQQVILGTMATAGITAAAAASTAMTGKAAMVDSGPSISAPLEI